MRGYIKKNFVDKGMCADFAIHDKGDGNPHAHVLLTTREVSEAGFGKKNRKWNGTAQLKAWRENWAIACNERLQGLGERIDHRTLEAQGIDREPTIHVGVVGKHMEHRGLAHDRARKNQEIIVRNESKRRLDIERQAQQARAEQARKAEQARRAQQEQEQKIAAQNEAKRVENTAKHMHELKEDYISLDKEISSLQEATAEAKRERNSLRVKAEEIAERAENIHAMGQRLDILRERRQSMGFFDSKKDIDNQMQQLERSHEQASSHFSRMYHFAPEQVAAEVTRLEIAAESKKRLQDKLQEKLTPLAEEKEAVRLEYQRQSLLADISPNRQEILERLDELEKESQARMHSVQDNLARVRCQRALDTITERDFHEILKKARPEHTQVLLELREREREHERLRMYQRGR